MKMAMGEPHWHQWGDALTDCLDMTMAVGYLQTENVNARERVGFCDSMCREDGWL